MIDYDQLELAVDKLLTEIEARADRCDQTTASLLRATVSSLPLEHQRALEAASLRHRARIARVRASQLEQEAQDLLRLSHDGRGPG